MEGLECAGDLLQARRIQRLGLPEHHINTPYLWSYSNNYTSGKYIADGIWSDSAVSRQCGAAVLLRRMAEKGQITLGAPAPAASKLPDPSTLVAVPYQQHQPSNPLEWEAAEDLQRLLSLFPGIFLKIDGIVGCALRTLSNRSSVVICPVILGRKAAGWQGG